MVCIADTLFSCKLIQLCCAAAAAGGFSVFAGVGERTREGNDLYREMIESVSADDVLLVP